jgi:hypothetical protein
MKIELTQYQENEDGSANCHVDMDREATHSLINYSLIKMLSQAAEEGRLYSPEFYDAEEEVDVNYFYDEDEDVEYYYVEEEDAWYCYDEDEDDWFVVEDEEEEEADGKVWLSLEAEQMDAIIEDELKRCLINTYNNNLFHKEDIDSNIHVRNACKTLLGYYMIPSEADDYLNGVAAVYEC